MEKTWHTSHGKLSLILHKDWFIRQRWVKYGLMALQMYWMWFKKVIYIYRIENFMFGGEMEVKYIDSRLHWLQNSNFDWARHYVLNFHIISIFYLQTIPSMDPRISSEVHNMLTEIEHLHQMGHFLGPAERIFVIVESCGSKRPVGMDL